jgi:hypothetical protein
MLRMIVGKTNCGPVRLGKVSCRVAIRYARCPFCNQRKWMTPAFGFEETDLNVRNKAQSGHSKLLKMRMVCELDLLQMP